MILIISDTHLGSDAQSTAQAQAVLACIEKHRQAAAARSITLEVYLLGDILNLYAGEGTPLAQAFFWQALKDMAINKGVKFYFMAGNRDFLITQKVLAPFHITLIQDPYILPDILSNILPDISPQQVDAPNAKRSLKILLSHGDQWVKGDHLYRFFRFITRLRFIQKCFLALPAAWRTKLAMGLRKKSQEAKKPSSEKNIYHKYNKYSEIDIPTLKKKYAGVDVIIHGHTHQPKQNIYQRENQENIENKENIENQTPLYYFVTSDWHQGCGYVLTINNDNEQKIKLSFYKNTSSK